MSKSDKKKESELIIPAPFLIVYNYFYIHPIISDTFRTNSGEGSFME